MVFISYSRVDVDFVDSLIVDLEESGIETWVTAGTFLQGSDGTGLSRKHSIHAKRSCSFFPKRRSNLKR